MNKDLMAAYENAIVFGEGRLKIDTAVTSAMKAEIDELYKAFAEAMSRYMYVGQPTINIYRTAPTGATLPIKFAGPASPAIAATVALGAIGWIVARRNLLSGGAKPSKAWIREVADWLARLVLGMFSDEPSPRPSLHG